MAAADVAFYRAHHSKTIDIYILFRVDSRHQLLARYYGQYVLYTPVRYIADVDKEERILSQSQSYSNNDGRQFVKPLGGEHRVLCISLSLSK